MVANHRAGGDVTPGHHAQLAQMEHLTDLGGRSVLATQLRLDVAAAQRAYETQLQELRVANLGKIPEVGAGVAFERDEDGRRSFGPVLDLEIMIFDNKNARVAKAASELRRVQFEADAVLQRAVTETRTAWLDVRTNLELVNFYRAEVIALARENFALAGQAFKAGQIDMTVVLETQREVILAEFQLNELEGGAASSLIELEYAAGGRLGHLETAPGHEIPKTGNSS